MFQIVEAFTGTLTNFIDAHGPKVVIGAFVVVVVGIILTVLRWTALGRGPQQD
jgi:hypothetical protein